jgi:signal transduction histidine kinase
MFFPNQTASPTAIRSEQKVKTLKHQARNSTGLVGMVRAEMRPRSSGCSQDTGQFARDMTVSVEGVRSWERGVPEHAAQPDAANDELRAFSCSVSHEMRAPLLAIDGYCHILLEDFGPDLPKHVRTYLKLVIDNARKMGQLIDNLLAFSRLSDRSPARQSSAPDQTAHLCPVEMDKEHDVLELSVVADALE